MKFLTKTLVGDYNYSNRKHDRDCYKEVRINGRKYLKWGTATATTAVAFQYKVFDPSINRSEYIVLVGIARQHPGDTALSHEDGMEIASVNALTNPVMTLTFPTKMDAETIECFMANYIDSLPVVFVKTKEELDELGKDYTEFNRLQTKTDNYYTQYYLDLCKSFPKKYSVNK